MHTAREPSHEMKAFFSRLLARPRVNQYGLFSRGVHNEGEIIACLRRNKNEHVWCLAEIVFIASTHFFSLSLSLVFLKIVLIDATYASEEKEGVLGC